MKYLNALNKIYGLGGKKMVMLINHFGEPQKAWNASLAQLLESGVGQALANKINSERLTIDPDEEWEKLTKENIQLVSIKESAYPQLLKEIPDHPYCIYMKGNFDCLKMPLIAIVGSRKLTSYGQQIAYGFARDLAKSEICIVSGLAYGVDAAAHSGALTAKGKTIAVLGNSLDGLSIAPRSNFQLAQEILRAGGLLISEFPVSTSANKFTFPARNRIMAGMSLGTLVVEAAEKSGSLITANLALDYNREIFAVPGPIFSPQSFGTNLLIKKGAKLITSAQDVLEELKLELTIKPPSEAQVVNLIGNEAIVFGAIDNESRHIDIITKLTKLNTSTVSSALAILEIKGLIKNVGGQNYIRLS